MVESRMEMETGMETPRSSTVATVAGLGAGWCAWKVQRAALVPLFDEGGAMSYNLAHLSDKMGQPLKIASWKDFYRSAGPPVMARTGAAMASFFVAGAAQALVSARYLTEAEPKVAVPPGVVEKGDGGG